MDVEGYTNKDFGDALSSLLEERQLSYRKFAEKCELSFQFIQQIATKKALPPKDEYIEKIAKAFGLKPEYFKEYRNRRLSEKLNALNFDKENYDVPLSQEEVQYLQKVIDRAKKEFNK